MPSVPQPAADAFLDHIQHQLWRATHLLAAYSAGWHWIETDACFQVVDANGDVIAEVTSEAAAADVIFHRYIGGAAC